METEGDGLEGWVFGNDGQLDGFLFRALEEDDFRRCRLGDGICGCPGLHYSGLVPGNFFNGVAEDLDVVDAEACDANDAGGEDDVCAVVFAADPAFDDGCVDAFANVGVEGH